MSHVLVARYTTEFVFKIPEGVVLTNENHWIKWNTLHITLPDGKEIEIEHSLEVEPDFKHPDSTEVQSADDWCLDDED